jgi:hypothetical protein
MAIQGGQWGKDVRASIDAALSKWAAEGGEHVVTVVKDDYLSGQALNRRSSNLLGSIYHRGEPGRFFFGTRVGYGVMWELGWNKSGTIFPTSKKCLAWKDERGQMVFRRWSRFKPQKPRKFLQPALEDSRAWLQSKAYELLKKAAAESFPAVQIPLEIGGGKGGSA